jgi:hypothetical protein
VDQLVVGFIAITFGAIGFIMGAILGASAGYSAGKDTLRIYYGEDDDDGDFFDDPPHIPNTPATNYRDN